MYEMYGNNYDRRFFLDPIRDFIINRKNNTGRVPTVLYQVQKFHLRRNQCNEISVIDNLVVGSTKNKET